MDYSDVVWAQSRQGIYLFLAACITHDPTFQFILALSWNGIFSRLNYSVTV